MTPTRSRKPLSQCVCLFPQIKATNNFTCVFPHTHNVIDTHCVFVVCLDICLVCFDHVSIIFCLFNFILCLRGSRFILGFHLCVSSTRRSTARPVVPSRVNGRGTHRTRESGGVRTGDRKHRSDCSLSNSGAGRQETCDATGRESDVREAATPSV